MSLKSSIALRLGISNINSKFVYAYNLSFFVQSLFDNNMERKKVLKSIRDYTHVNYKRLKFLWDSAEKLAKEGKQGAFVETGVWKGGCAGILAYISKKYSYSHPLYFFDSFEGLPEPTAKDGKTAIAFSEGLDSGNLISIGKVNADENFIKELLFEKLQIDPTHVNIIKGWFQNTLPENRTKVGKIALLRLDGDWYESTKIPLNNLYNQVISGGYIVIDDYYYWEGCRKAVDDFIKDEELQVKIKRQDSSGAYFIKP